MHSPLEIAQNYVQIGIHKVRLSAFKMLILGAFAGMFIGFAGIASTVGGATVENPSVSRLVFSRREWRWCLWRAVNCLPETI